MCQSIQENEAVRWLLLLVSERYRTYWEHDKKKVSFAEWTGTFIPFNETDRHTDRERETQNKILEYTSRVLAYSYLGAC